MNESNLISSLDWVALSREFKSLTEAGLRYSASPDDRERYQRLHELACWDTDKQRHPRWPEHVDKLVFFCRFTGGMLATSHGTSGTDFSSIDHLSLLCPHRAAKHYLKLAWQYAANPSLPTSFD